MAIARETGAKLIKPLEGAIVRRFTVGAALEAGEVAAMMSDGARPRSARRAVANQMRME